MSCTLGPLVDEANVAAEAAYEICEVDPSGLTLAPEELEIVEEGNWCQWQPTYTVPDIGGYLPTLVTQVKDKVYEELWAELQAEITGLAANAAIVYSTKIERVSGDEAMAGQLEASYAQWESGSSALASSVQTALASQGLALSQQILATEASLDDKITANSEFYQTSLASVGETMAASGVLNSVTLADGSKVVSGFRSQASSTTGSEFTIFADTFKILNRVPNGSGGYDYSSVVAPFTVQNDTVYIGAVNTSEPQITYLGEFASAPSTTGLDKNTVYKNTVNGNSYIFNGTSWVLWIPKGADGAAGATGPRGYDGATGATGARGAGNFAGPSGSASWNDSTANSVLYGLGLSPVNNDRVTLYYPSSNPTWSAIKYYSDGSWLTAALVVNGNAVVTGTLTADKIVANHIGAANSVRSSATIVSVGTMNAAITTGTLIAQLTYSNPTSTTVKLFVSALGRTGYYHAGGLNSGTIGMSIMQGGSSLCDNGWTPAWQDTKAFGAVSAVAANSSVTYYLYGQRGSSDSAWICTAVMSLTVVGVANA